MDLLPTRTPTLTKKDLARRVVSIARRAALPCEPWVHATIEALRDLMAEADPEVRIELRDFGVFEVKKTRAKPKARNPKTNETVFIPARRKTHFKPSKKLRVVASAAARRPRLLRSRMAAPSSPPVRPCRPAARPDVGLGRSLACPPRAMADRALDSRSVSPPSTSALRRVGVAVTDPLRLFAQPVGAYGPGEALDAVRALHAELGLAVVVVGWPLDEDGGEGAAVAASARSSGACGSSCPACRRGAGRDGLVAPRASTRSSPAARGAEPGARRAASTPPRRASSSRTICASAEYGRAARSPKSRVRTRPCGTSRCTRGRLA